MPSRDVFFSLKSRRLMNSVLEYSRITITLYMLIINSNKIALSHCMCKMNLFITQMLVKHWDFPQRNKQRYFTQWSKTSIFTALPTSS